MKAYARRLNSFTNGFSTNCQLVRRIPGFSKEVRADVWGFFGGELPGGSTKSLSVLGMILYLDMQGILAGCTGLVASSSGNLAIALVLFGKMLDIAITVVLDPRTAPGKLAELIALGARIVMVDKPDPTSGWVGARIKRAREIAATEGLIDLDQYNNPGAAIQHHYFTANYILHAMAGDIDLSVCAISTGATACGIFSRLREDSHNIGCLAVDCEGSVLSGGPAGPHLLTGIGAQTFSGNMRIACSAIAGLKPARVTDDAAFSECHRLLASDQIWVGGSSGAVLAAIRSLGATARDKRIIAILPDSGHSYATTLYNASWLRNNNVNLNLSAAKGEDYV